MDTRFGLLFVILLAVCIGAPYLLRVAPKTRRQWTYVTVALVFIAWLLLPLMAPVRTL